MGVNKEGGQTTTNYIVNQIMSVLLCMLLPEHEMVVASLILISKAAIPISFKYLKLCRTTDSSTV